MGGSSIVWSLQHNVGHHPNSNKQGQYYDEDYDPDARSGFPIVRITPNHPWKPHHRFQYIFVWFLYGGVAMKWFITDIKSLSRRKYVTLDMVDISKGQLIAQFITKIFCLIYLFAIPAYLHSIQTGLLVLIIVFWTNGNVFVLMFSVNHLTAPSTYPNESTVERDWAKLQVLTATNYSTDSTMWKWLSAGLNCQIEHHLFPYLCHVHLKKIAPIVRQTCKEYQVPYQSFDGYYDALSSHALLLKRLGEPESKKQ